MAGYRYRAIVDTVPASESLALLSDWEERLMWRIVSQTDDFGAFHASPAKVRAECVPLLPVTDAAVAAALENIVRAGHGEVYYVGGRAYLRFVNFDEYQPPGFLRARGVRGRRRFPEPRKSPANTEGHRGVVRDLQGRFSKSPANDDHAQEVEVEPLTSESFQDSSVRAATNAPRESTAFREQAVAPDAPVRRSRRGHLTTQPRPRDELWDTFVALLGEPVTRSERGRRNRALKELREAGVEPSEVRRRAALYRQLWPHITLTATGLVANWSTLVAEGGADPNATYNRFLAEQEARA